MGGGTEKGRGGGRNDLLFILLLSLLACLITHAADKALAGNVSKQIKQKRTRSNNSNNSNSATWRPLRQQLAVNQVEFIWNGVETEQGTRRNGTC